MVAACTGFCGVRLGLVSFGGWAAALAFFLLLLEAAAEAEDVDLAIAAYGRIQNFMMIDKRILINNYCMSPGSEMLYQCTTSNPKALSTFHINNQILIDASYQ